MRRIAQLLTHALILCIAGSGLACTNSVRVGEIRPVTRPRDAGPRPRIDAGIDAGIDAVIDAGIDAGRADSDAGPEPSQPRVGFGENVNALTPADYSCRAARAAPSGGATTARTASIEGFFDALAPYAQGLSVQFFPDNNLSIDGVCVSPCTETISDAGGQVSVMAPSGGWFAYRIAPAAIVAQGQLITFPPVAQTNVLAPDPPGEVLLSAISDASLRRIRSVLSIANVPNTTTLIGRALDCNDRPVANGSIRVFDPTEGRRLATMFHGDGVREFYFDGRRYPLFVGRRTHVDGAYGATNVPYIPPTEQYRVELWGALTENGPLELLSCELAPATEDGVTFVDLGPLRTDGPPACGQDG